MAVKKHRYGVSWSAPTNLLPLPLLSDPPTYRDFKAVMAANQREAVAVVKKQLGKRVKKHGLNKFEALRWRPSQDIYLPFGAKRHKTVPKRKYKPWNYQIV